MEADPMETEVKAPVVMIGYARVRTLELSLNRLAGCPGVGKRDVYLYLDAPAVAAHQSDCGLMYQCAERIRQSRLPNLQIIRRTQNYGVPKNQIASISEILNRYGRCIFFEDDILVSDTFLDYMDRALELYSSDRRIFCVNGYTPYYYVGRPNKDVYLSPCLSAWGVGLWADRWNEVDFELEDFFTETKADQKLKDEIFRRRPDVFGMLSAISLKQLKTWDTQCIYSMAKNGQYAITPKYQLTKNIGYGKDGLHCAYNPFYAHLKYYNFKPNLTKGVRIDEYMLKRYTAWSGKKFSTRNVYRFLLKFLNRYTSEHLEPVTL